MKFVYTDELLRSVFYEQILPGASEKVREFRLNNLAIGVIRRLNVDEVNISCMLDMTASGLLIVNMHMFDAGKAVGYTYIDFNEVQGVKCSEGPVFYKLKLQLINGRFFKINVRKNNQKNLPHQAAGAGNIVNSLTSRFSADIRNKKHKRNKRNDRVFGFLYLVTLGFSIFLPFRWITDIKNSTAVTFIILGIMLLHMVVFFSISYLIDRIRLSRFRKVYDPIIAEYNRTQDAKVFYDRLQGLKEPPKRTTQAAVYLISLSTAADKLGKKEEAYSYLMQIDTRGNKKLEDTVREQKAYIDSTRL